MIINRLLHKLQLHLQEAKEIWVAVALMNEFGFEVIEKANVGCKKNFLIGTDLPTSPNVLRNLLALKTQSPNLYAARTFDLPDVFHPKVYLIQNLNDEFVGFIGSANATRGGLANNVEMSFFIEDKEQCENLLRWFNVQFSKGNEFDNEYVEEYEKVYRKNKSLGSTQKSNRNKLKKVPETVPGDNLQIETGQFFNQSHFDAYDPKFHYQTDWQTVKSRRSVRERFLELNELIFPRFADYGIDDLHLPANSAQYISQHWHSRGNTHRPQEAIWLNYGKSPSQLANNHETKFVDNIRIQIILRRTTRESYIGIWLFLGKPSGSYWDRAYFKQKTNDTNFIKVLFEYLKSLGDSYWIENKGIRLEMSVLNNQRNLSDFLKRDDYSDYYMIGRNYDPNDPELAADTIEETVLIEFSKLYKIYELIKAR